MGCMLGVKERFIETLSYHRTCNTEATLNRNLITLSVHEVISVGRGTGVNTEGRRGKVGNEMERTGKRERQ